MRPTIGQVVLAILMALAFTLQGSVSWSQSASEKAFLQMETGAHTAFIRRLDVAEDRGLLVTAADDKTARVWDLATGELRQVLRPAIGEGEIGSLYGVAIHPRLDLVAVGGATGNGVGQHRILIFSLTTGKLTTTFDARGGNIKKLAWTRDGSLLLAVYAGDNALRAFDSAGVQVYEQVLSAPAYGLTVSYDGKAAASSLDGRVVLVSAQAGNVSPMRIIKTHTDQAVGVSFSPDGSKLVVGFRKPSTPPEVIDVATGRSLLKLQKHDVVEGTQLTVGWSQDARQIIVGGSGYNQRKRFSVYFHDATSGRVTAIQEVANDTVFDLVALSDARVAWASHDGTWGVASHDQVPLTIRSSVADLKGPETLLVSADGRRVGFTFAWGSEPATYDFSRRVLTMGAAFQLEKPVSSRSDRPVWQDTLTAKVNGRAVDLDPAEVSRALDYFTAGGEAALGTSHRLLRIGSRGEVRWQVRTSGEVRSVNVTADNRFIVSGMSDGTLRWWRASDGAPLLALLAARDGRWVAWTPEGYFDASAGADRLVGWTVNRAGGMGADHFSLNRFRERFNRPDLIDRVLETATSVATMDPGATGTTAMQFPPVLAPVELVATKPTPGEIKIPIAIRAQGEVQVEVRVDGRPVPSSINNLPAAPAGSAHASQGTTATIPTPLPGSLVQVIAQDSRGVSEPLGFQVELSPLVQEVATLKTVLPVEQPAVSLTPGGASRILKPTTPSTSAPAQPGLYVLAIGISDYKRPEYKLNLAAKDARDFSEAMRIQTGRLYRDVQTRSLVNEQASRPAIISNLKWLSDAVGKGDIGMLFMAGHGVNSKTGQYHFLPYEGDHEQLDQTGLPEVAIRDTLRRMRGKAIFFVDTCYGGNVVGNLRSASRELARMANDLAAAENGVVVFASSSGKQLSEENDSWGNGAFTKAVLAGLSGKADLAQTGRITFKALDYYVSEEVSKLTEGRQTPVTISPVGVPDFTIARPGA